MDPGNGMDPLRHLCLYSGAGIPSLVGSMLGWRTVCYVERDQYCQRVLLQRMADGVLDVAPIWDNADIFNGFAFRGGVDVVSAGFPCQPFSVAGHQLAEADPRNGWPTTLRIIREARPRLVLLENVPGLLAGSHGYFGTVLGDLAEAGYDARWGVLSAQDVGAPHVRKRLWVLAYLPDADGERRGAGRSRRTSGSDSGIQNAAGELADPDGGRFEGQRFSGLLDSERAPRGPDPDRCGGEIPDPIGDGVEGEFEAGAASWPVAGGGRDWWAAEPGVGGLVNGLAPDMDEA